MKNSSLKAEEQKNQRFSPEKRGSKVFQYLKLIAPWFVALSVLIYVFSKVSAVEALGEMGVKEIVFLVPLSTLGVGILLLLDSFALWRLFSMFLESKKYLEILRVRGSSYLLAAVNYNAGQGGLAFFLSKKSSCSAWDVTAVVLMGMGLQLVILSLAAGAGALMSSSSLGHSILPYCAGILLGFLIYLLLVSFPPKFLKTRPFFQPLIEGGAMNHLKAIAFKAPHLTALFVYHWLAMSLFGIHVPISESFVRLSLLFFVGALPISVQGLGTGQAAAVILFSDYCPGGAPVVLAYSLSLWAFSVLVQVSLGLWFLKKRPKLTK